MSRRSTQGERGVHETIPKGTPERIAEIAAYVFCAGTAIVLAWPLLGHYVR
jgi:hypothetical protein